MSSSPLRKILIALCLLVAAGSARLRAEVREIATISTSEGVMEFELYRDSSPRAVSNFKYLADSHFYDGTAFHRLIAGFMVQGGDPNSRYPSLAASYGGGGPGYTIPNEPVNTALFPNRTHLRGVLSMANAGGTATTGSQFFIMFGPDADLDSKHAQLGFMINGESVLAALENKPVGANAARTENSAPLSRLVVNSVRIRSEVISGTLATTYPPGTVGGLLRNYDRNIVGSYQIAITSKGALSGQFQYYGRTGAFAGKLTPVSGTPAESECIVHMDPKAAVPLRVRIRLRRPAATGGTVSVVVCALNSDSTDITRRSDVTDATLGAAASELAIPTLNSHYTVAFEAPVTSVGAAFEGVSGKGFLTVNFHSATGLCSVTGRLADNRAITLSTVTSSEGGRRVLPIHFHELTAQNLALRALFPTVPLGNWSGIATAFRLVGGLEVLASGDAETQDPANYRYLTWYRQAQTTGVTTAIDGFLLATMAPWTPPTAGHFLSPFVVTSGAGHISSVNLSTTGFQLARTNTTASFPTNPWGVLLKFTPSDGTFQGSFAEPNGSRRTFQGVCLQGAGFSKLTGFSLGTSTSLPVSLSAP